MTQTFGHDANVLKVRKNAATREKVGKSLPSESDPLIEKQEDLKRQHSLAMEDLDAFSAFLHEWETIAEDAVLDGNTQSQGLTNFEDYSAAAVRDFLEPDKAKHDGSAAISLGAHDCAAALVTADGTIRQTNLKAHTQEELVVGETLAQCGIMLGKAEPIPILLAKQKPDLSMIYQLLQVKNERRESYVTLAVSQVNRQNDAQPLFLILLISPPDTKIAMTLLARKFNFTLSETEIASAFLDGIPLREIAKNRGRSYTTIRNQFQSVLDKSGCASQTALFRLSFSFQQLAENATDKLQAQSEQSGRVLTLPRPKGRVVEVLLSGDEMGQPLLNFASLFGNGLTPDLNAHLRERGILFMSVSRPGFGGTSFATKGQDLYDCFAGDVRAVLDSLEIDCCPAIARASAARPFYGLITRLPDRISRGVVVNGMIPRNYIEKKTVVSNWTKALMSASIVSYPIAKLILGTGSSLLKRSEGASFLTKMYQNSESDCAVPSDPQVVQSIRQGVEASAQQGLTASAQDIVDAFQDWSADLKDLQTPITLYHGKDDPNIPITGVIEFVDDYAKHLTLVAETTGGGQLCYSHFDRVLDLTR